MSTQAGQPPSPLLTRMRQGFQIWWRNLYRQTFRRGDFEALAIAFFMLTFPILALNAAGWADGLLILLPITAIALLVSHLLARSGFSEGYALVLALLYGFATIITVQLIALPGNLSPIERLNEMTQRIRLWATDVRLGETGSENLVFAMALSILFWVLAHNVIWHVIRLDRVWRAIIPPGFLLVIVNLAYIGDANLDIYMLGFLFFALLLIVHNYTRTREYQWRYQRIRYSKRIHRGFTYTGAAIAIIVLLFTQLLPVGNGEDDWEQFEEFLGSDPIAAITDLWSRIFSDLDGRGIATTDYYSGDRLDLTGAVQLSDDPVMQVTVDGINPATTRFYWRSTAFDFYDGRGWEHRRNLQASKNSEGMRFNTGLYAARQNVTQRFEMAIRASLLIHAAPEPSAIDNVVVEAELNCVDGSSNCVSEQRESDVAIIRTRDPLRNGDTYTAVSSVSIATATDLQSAGTNYPQWVRETYLQGTNYLSPEARNVAEGVIRQTGASTPYDIAKAIETYLRTTIPYSETIPAPAFGQDPIDYFLFDIQRGYCTYYATTMVMMLRAQGIPARMSSGFAQGEFQGANRFLVKENDAHTWVEVYFPGYGWVNFEPTADESPVDRPGDPQFDDFDLETPEPTPSPTFSPSQTPPTAQPQLTLTPTLTPTPTQDFSQPAPAITSTPEFAPTQTVLPSPTPTLNPAPMVVTVDDDDNSNLFDTILLILLGIVISITLIILAVLFTIWWIEHRGLGGLSPAQKAYARLAIYGRWLGITLTNRQTPHERRVVLVEAVPEGSEPIDVITDLYTQERFGPPAPTETTPQGQDAARTAWGSARRAFIRRKFRRK